MQPHSLPVPGPDGFAAEIRAGLTRPGQKELPSKYLYDEIGSALFEAICVLPEYGLTRADVRLLRRHSSRLFSSVLTALIAGLACSSPALTASFTCLTISSSMASALVRS